MLYLNTFIQVKSTQLSTNARVNYTSGNNMPNNQYHKQTLTD